MQDEPTLNENLRLLRRRFPGLWESLRLQKPHQEGWVLQATPSGIPTVSWQGHLLHSSYNPHQEARRLVGTEENRATQLALFCGLGLGYQVEAFLKEAPSAHVVVVEPDFRSFLSALASRDLSTLLTSERVHLLLAPTSSQVIDYLAQRGGIAKLRVFFLQALYPFNRTFFDELATKLETAKKRDQINQNTLTRFGKCWIRNLVANLPVLAHSSGIQGHRGHFSGLPGLILAGGPSLKELLEVLPRYREKVVLLAVDTGVGLLKERGIEPDFIVTVDPQYWNSRHLDENRFQSAILLADSSAYPSVFHEREGATILSGSLFPLGSYLESIINAPKGALRAGGSVATAAWSFARALGLNPLYFGGLDLGFPRGQIYCPGTLFAKRMHWLSERMRPAETAGWYALHEGHKRERMSNEGAVLFTNQRMEVYIQWFEEEMRRHPQVKTFNLASQGVRIEGMPCVSFADLESLSSLEKEILERKKALLCDMKKQKKGGVSQQPLVKLLTEFGTLVDLAQRALQLVKLSHSKGGKELSKIFKQLNYIDRRLSNSFHKEILGFFFDPDTLEKLAKNPDGPDSHNSVLLKMEFFYDQIFQSASFYRQIFEKGLKKARIAKLFATLPDHGGVDPPQVSVINV